MYCTRTSTFVVLAVVGCLASGCEDRWFRSVPHTRGGVVQATGRASAPAPAVITHTQLGVEKKQAGDLQGALQSFHSALAVNPRHVPAHLGVGDVHQLLGDYAKAAEAYQRARNLAPGSFEANYKLAVMQQLLAKIHEAIDNYLNALTINPDSFEANSNLAAAYMQIGKTQQALPYAERAVQIKPDSQHALLNLGAVYTSVGRDEQAIQAYRSAADLGDLTPEATVQLANALIRMERPERALNVLEIVTRAHPDYAPAFERLGYVHFRLGQLDKSMEAYETALRLDGADHSAHNGLGVSLMAQYLQDSTRNTELRDRALESWRTSVRINPNQPRIVDLINRYGGL